MSDNDRKKCRKCRRSKQKLHLKGARCLTAKCSLEKRNFPPGFKPGNMMRKSSEYGIRLREKQKVRIFYGISEKQMRKYFSKANKTKGLTGHIFLSLCERRLDNFISRGKFSASRSESRQLISHGHFKINDKKVDIPSYVVKSGDIISVNKKISDFIKKRITEQKEIGLPTWIDFNAAKNTITVLHEPKREEIDLPIEDQLIVEFYSR
ncbi:30S ribosomal protein S4 [Candidatus Margulisiibacteriota bacterium]